MAPRVNASLPRFTGWDSVSSVWTTPWPSIWATAMRMDVVPMSMTATGFATTEGGVGVCSPMEPFMLFPSGVFAREADS